MRTRTFLKVTRLMIPSCESKRLSYLRQEYYEGLVSLDSSICYYLLEFLHYLF
jgi:hypothetical protein